MESQLRAVLNKNRPCKEVKYSDIAFGDPDIFCQTATCQGKIFYPKTYIFN